LLRPCWLQAWISCSWFILPLPDTVGVNLGMLRILHFVIISEFCQELLGGDPASCPAQPTAVQSRAALLQVQSGIGQVSKSDLWPFRADSVECNDNRTEISCVSSSFFGRAFCVPREYGCPVKCGDNEHTCHMPPTCMGCQGQNWCSPNPCPSSCLADHIQCTLPDLTTQCAHRDLGCPVACPAHQHTCHVPPPCDTCAAVNFCSEHACPAVCKQAETKCVDSDGSEFCVQADRGCPVTCPLGHSSCHAPPACATCTATNYCSKGSCPVVCSATQIRCNRADGTDYCTPRAQGCPVNCTDGEHKCFKPPDCDGCIGRSFCLSTPCPTLCKADEVSCPKGDGGNACVPAAKGCPVVCKAGEYKCLHEDSATHWCSQAPCPTVCKEGELKCPHPGGGNSCATLLEGCPVTCVDGEYKCHLPPYEQGDRGQNWCSVTPCPSVPYNGSNQ